MNIKISIITASYNKEKFISDTISSVLKQTYQNWEFIIIDDYSLDNTIKSIKRFKDNRIKLLENFTNKGANFCRNLGIMNSTGNYIMFLDADDILIPTCLENRILKSIQFPNANLLVFAMGVFHTTIGDDKRTWRPKPKNNLTDFLTHDLPWSIMQPLWKKDFLVSLKGFDVSFNRLQDVELHTRALLKNNCNVQVFPNLLDCYYRIDEGRTDIKIEVFLEKWLLAVKQYVRKFQPITIEKQIPKKINGTIFQYYLTLLFYHRQKKISKKIFIQLEEKLFDDVIKCSMSFSSRLLFKATRFFNLLPFKIKGINFILKKMITLSF